MTVVSFVPAFDPLASLRGSDAPAIDVFVQGTVFFDLVFNGLPELPRAGTEVWADEMTSCPGGVANLAVAASRLGLATSLGAAFGDDPYSDLCWRSLCEQDHIDLSRSRRYPDWRLPVTVSLSIDGDRRMISCGGLPPQSSSDMIGTLPPVRSITVDLDADRPLGVGHPERRWVDQAAASGALVFADVGWDPTQEWSASLLDQLVRCHAFIPNAVEAMGYTRTSTARDALHAIADLVPLAVVTNGGDGALGIDSTTGEEVTVQALPVPVVDPTGAGDVFSVAMLVGSLAGWPLRHRMEFASLCSSLTVQRLGGSRGAPDWAEIAAWWQHTRARAGHGSTDGDLARRFAFLDDLLPTADAEGTPRSSDAHRPPPQ